MRTARGIPCTCERTQLQNTAGSQKRPRSWRLLTPRKFSAPGDSAYRQPIRYQTRVPVGCSSDPRSGDWEDRPTSGTLSMTSF